MNFILLNDRITLLVKQGFADDNGKAVTESVFSQLCWAHIEPVRKNFHRPQPMTLWKNTNTTVFKVFIRKVPNSEHDRHAKINALRWKRKEYKLLCPFAASDKVGRFWEALCIEGGEQW
jgi:head-tail adaptor